MLILSQGVVCGFFDDPLGYPEDGIIFQGYNSAIGAGLYVLGNDLSVFIFLCPKVVSDGLFLNVQLISYPLYTACG